VSTTRKESRSKKTLQKPLAEPARHWRAKPPISGQGRGPKGRQQGRVLGEGAAKNIVHQLGGLWERCKLPQRRPGQSPAANSFLAFYRHQVAPRGTCWGPSLGGACPPSLSY